jgi:hypothetical protein
MGEMEPSRRSDPDGAVETQRPKRSCRDREAHDAQIPITQLPATTERYKTSDYP